MTSLKKIQESVTTPGFISPTFFKLFLQTFRKDFVKIWLVFNNKAIEKQYNLFIFLSKFQISVKISRLILFQFFKNFIQHFIAN